MSEWRKYKSAYELKEADTNIKSKWFLTYLWIRQSNTNSYNTFLATLVDIGQASQCFGVQITYDEDELTIDQEKTCTGYIGRILHYTLNVIWSAYNPLRRYEK